MGKGRDKRRKMKARQLKNRQSGVQLIEPLVRLVADDVVYTSTDPELIGKVFIDRGRKYIIEATNGPEATPAEA